jgi:colanic acid biosynthesis protein WcaH
VALCTIARVVHGSATQCRTKLKDLVLSLSLVEYKWVMETMPVVCVDGLIVNERRQFLLVRRLNAPLKGEFWLPGGRLHKGEKLRDGIRRKMREELGAEVEVIRDLGHFEEFFHDTAQDVPGGFHAISVVFQLRLDSQEINLDEQSGEWAWFAELPPRLAGYNLISRAELE